MALRAEIRDRPEKADPRWWKRAPRELVSQRVVQMEGASQGVSGKESACQQGDSGSVPGWGRSWSGTWQPAALFLPGTFVDREAWGAVSMGLPGWAHTVSLKDRLPSHPSLDLGWPRKGPWTNQLTWSFPAPWSISSNFSQHQPSLQILRITRTCQHCSYGPANSDPAALVSRLPKVFCMKLPMKTAYHKAPYSYFMQMHPSLSFLGLTHISVLSLCWHWTYGVWITVSPRGQEPRTPATPLSLTLPPTVPKNTT